MIRRSYFTLALAGAVLGGSALALAGITDANKARYMKWDVHQKDRPQPPVVDPGYPGTQERPGKAPSDAVVLFDGSSLDAFHNGKGEPAGWEITEDGSMVRVGRKGGATTKQAFGDMQLHVEWKTPPSQANRSGQGRGNSGIFIMGKYEVQVLDNKGNETYPDGMAGSVYGQFPPMVNAGRGIDQWQSYDIIWRRPHFNADGSLKKPATVTVLHNGVLVQDHQQLMGPTTHKRRTSYSAHPDKLPITFQNHGEEAHYRNIWVRELPPSDNPYPYED